MCGRFTLRAPMRAIADAFAVDDVPLLEAHYNVAPTQNIAAVRVNADSHRRQLVMLHWGLVPFWAESPAIGNRMINARAETLASKAAFREAFRQRRCIVVADGFFEWRKERRGKQPYHIVPKGEMLFGFAGLWERWKHNEQTLESCTIVTTEANELIQSLHDRMPAILAPEDYARWLERNERDPAKLQPLLRPFPADEMELYPVNPIVNNVKHDDPKCIERQQHLFS